MTSLLDKINKLGLKMTDQRRTIVKVLAESNDHPDVELVYQRVAKIDSKIGIATAVSYTHLTLPTTLVV